MVNKTYAFVTSEPDGTHIHLADTDRGGRKYYTFFTALLWKNQFDNASALYDHIGVEDSQNHQPTQHNSTINVVFYYDFTFFITVFLRKDTAILNHKGRKLLTQQQKHADTLISQKSKDAD